MCHLAIYLYDQTTTFHSQIKYIWSWHISAVTVLFALLHLSTLSTYILYIVFVYLTQCKVRTLQLISMVNKLIVALAVRLSRILDLVVALLT